MCGRCSQNIFFNENDIVLKMFHLLKMHCPIEFSMTVGGCGGDLSVSCHSKARHEEEGVSGGRVKV